MLKTINRQLDWSTSLYEIIGNFSQVFFFSIFASLLSENYPYQVFFVPFHNTANSTLLLNMAAVFSTGNGP